MQQKRNNSRVTCCAALSLILHYWFTSPYASRPAAGSADSSSEGYCAQSNKQQQWWHKQQQHQLVRPQPPEVPPSGCISNRSELQHSSRPLEWRVQATDVDASKTTQGPTDRHDRSAAQYAYTPLAEASMQYYYLTTSPPVKLPIEATAHAAAAAVAPFKVSVYTEADMLAKQQQQQGVQGPASMLSSLGAGGFNSLLSGCDVFCSLSSSRQMLVMSLVARGTAATDNMFVGVTSASHADQRGLQVCSVCCCWSESSVASSV